MTRQSKIVTVVILAIILIVGTGLRFYKLGSESLWNDELASWQQSNYSTIGEVLEFGSIPDTHPPLFQIILFFIIRYFGDTEFHLRFASAISGIASIFAMYWLGKTVFSYREGLIASLLMSVLWVPIYYSQEARNYSFLILFSILATGYWFRIYLNFRDSSGFRLGNAIGYVSFALLACYTHYFGLLLVTLQGLGGVFLSFLNRRALVITFGLYLTVGLGYLPWVPSMVMQFSHTQKVSWVDPPKLTAFPAFISFTFNRLDPIAIIVLLMLMFLLINSIIKWRRSQSSRIQDLLISPEFLLGYWLIIPLALVYVISVVWKPFLTQRNLLISLPAVYLLLARSITSLPVSKYLKGALALVFGLIPLYHMIFDMGYYKVSYKEQFREVVEVVLNLDEKYTDAPVIAFAKSPEFFNYYFDQFGSSKRVDIMGLEESDFAEIQRHIESDASQYFWYIAGHTYSPPELLSLLETEYRAIEMEVFSGAMVWLFREY